MPILFDKEAVKAQMAEDLAISLSPMLFAAKCGYPELDEWQTKALTSKSRYQCWNCGRQVGKSTVAALYSLHFALNRPNSLVLLCSPSLRQSQEMHKRVMDMYAKLGRQQETVAESALRVAFTNGSRIIALPSNEQNLRGYTCDLAILDEASRMPDDTWVALRPMLSVSQGKMILLSSPWSRSGFFFEVWTSGGREWERARVKSTECSRISKEYLKQELEVLGPHFFKMEYLAEFGEDEASLFRFEDIQRAFQEPVEAWQFDDYDNNDTEDLQPIDFCETDSDEWSFL